MPGWRPWGTCSVAEPGSFLCFMCREPVNDFYAPDWDKEHTWVECHACGHHGRLSSGNWARVQTLGEVLA